MSHAPARHRATHRAPRPSRRRPSARMLTAAAIGGVVLTGGAVGAQAVVGGSSDSAEASSAEPALASAADQGASRSADRPVLSAIDEASAKAAAQAKKIADQDAADRAERKKKAADEAAAEKKAQEALDNAREDPKGAARTLLAERGWSGQFSCLDSLWSGESGWNYQATNPSSGAYGIPQSLPADKMATAGADWKTNPVTQITWGLDYIKRTYGTPCSAQSFKSGNGWY